MHLENLADVHPGRNAKGVEADVDGGSVVEVGHVFLGNDGGDNALVSVPPTIAGPTRLTVTPNVKYVSGDRHTVDRGLVVLYEAFFLRMLRLCMPMVYLGGQFFVDDSYAVALLAVVQDPLY
jgi:hypothetical protein